MENNTDPQDMALWNTMINDAEISQHHVSQNGFNNQYPSFHGDLVQQSPSVFDDTTFSLQSSPPINSPSPVNSPLDKKTASDDSNDQVYVRRPLNPFLLFAAEKRPHVLKLLASLDESSAEKPTMVSANKLLGRMWKAMPESERIAYQNKSSRLKREHKEMMDANPHLKVRPPKINKNTKIDVRVENGAHISMQKLDDVNSPQKISSTTPISRAAQLRETHDECGRQFVKRPPNPFMCFVIEKRPAIMEQKPGARMCEINNALGEAWRKLSAADREPYNQRAAIMKAAHNQRMAEDPTLTVRPVRFKKTSPLPEIVLENNGNTIELKPAAKDASHDVEAPAAVVTDLLPNSSKFVHTAEDAEESVQRLLSKYETEASLTSPPASLLYGDEDEYTGFDQDPYSIPYDTPEFEYAYEVPADKL